MPIITNPDILHLSNHSWKTILQCDEEVGCITSSSVQT